MVCQTPLAGWFVGSKAWCSASVIHHLKARQTFWCRAVRRILASLTSVWLCGGKIQINYVSNLIAANLLSYSVLERHLSAIRQPEAQQSTGIFDVWFHFWRGGRA